MISKLEKAAETRRKKLESSLKDLGEPIKRKKTVVRKKREMTEVQKQAARERLQAAREAKQSSNASVHESIRNLPPEHPLSAQSVKGWIKSNKDLLKSIREYENSSNWKERLQYQSVENYIKNLNDYLRTGVYNDLFWGENRENIMGYVCHAMAYDKNGDPKRSDNTFYRDIGLYEHKRT